MKSLLTVYSRAPAAQRFELRAGISSASGSAIYCSLEIAGVSVACLETVYGDFISRDNDILLSGKFLAVHYAFYYELITSANSSPRHAVPVGG